MKKLTGQLTSHKDFVEVMKGFPIQSISPKQKVQYVQFEKSLLACASTLDFQKFNAPTRAQFEIIAQNEFVNSDKHFNIRELQNFGTLEVLLNQVTLLYADRRKEIESVKKQAAAAGFGFYTTEQETDEVSVELLALIGVDPKSALAGQYLFGDQIEREGGNTGAFEVSIAECRRLQAQDWKTQAQSAKPYVQIGLLSDPHHGPCYRVFNLDRDIRAHGYKVTPALKVPAPAWPIVLSGLRTN